jgi:hypothetical protein
MRTAAIVVLIISVLLCATGACLLAGAGGLFQFDSNRRSTWIEVTGIVTGQRTSTTTDSSGNPSTVYCTVVTYTTLEGQEFEVDTSECSFPIVNETGESVQMLYDPANPASAELKNGIGRAFTLGGLSVLTLSGLACILPALLGLIVSVFLFVRSRKPAAAM